LTVASCSSGHREGSGENTNHTQLWSGRYVVDAPKLLVIAVPLARIAVLRPGVGEHVRGGTVMGGSVVVGGSVDTLLNEVEVSRVVVEVVGAAVVRLHAPCHTRPMKPVPVVVENVSKVMCMSVLDDATLTCSESEPDEKT
jgi:hypothetical protein